MVPLCKYVEYDFVQKLQIVNNARKLLFSKKIPLLFYFYNDEFNKWFSLKMKNPGCFVCTYCVLHYAPQKLTLSQFFPLPSYDLVLKKHERDATSPVEQKTSLRRKSKAKSAFAHFVPVQRLFPMQRRM